jgi:glutathione S-transferase
MYDLYIANKNYSSWSLRPWILMKELAIPFTEHLTPFAPTGNWQAIRRFSPSGRVPCLHHEGRAVWDSLAIAEYLAERHQGVWPVNADARAFARCVAAEMHSGFAALRQNCSMSCGVRVRLHQISAELNADLARVQEIWSEGVKRFGGPYLAGAAFSAADAFYCPVAFRAQTYALPLNDTAAAYANHLLQLAGMREWYAAALAERWREVAHDAETAAAGKVVEDLRAS